MRISLLVLLLTEISFKKVTNPKVVVVSCRHKWHLVLHELWRVWVGVCAEEELDGALPLLLGWCELIFFFCVSLAETHLEAFHLSVCWQIKRLSPLPKARAGQHVWGTEAPWSYTEKVLTCLTKSLFKIYIYCLCFFLQRGEEREKRGREISMCSCLSCAPHKGPSPQPRNVPWLGIKPVTLWFTGWRSIHWATPARAIVYAFTVVPISPSSPLHPAHPSLPQSIPTPSSMSVGHAYMFFD